MTIVVCKDMATWSFAKIWGDVDTPNNPLDNKRIDLDGESDSVAKEKIMESSSANSSKGKSHSKERLWCEWR